MNIWLELPSQLRVELFSSWLDLRDCSHLDEAFVPRAIREEYLYSIRTDNIRLHENLTQSLYSAALSRRQIDTSIHEDNGSKVFSPLVEFLEWVDHRNLRVNAISFTGNIQDEMRTLFSLHHHIQICESVIDISFQNPQLVHPQILLPLLFRCCRVERLNLSKCIFIADEFFQTLADATNGLASVRLETSIKEEEGDRSNKRCRLQLNDRNMIVERNMKDGYEEVFELSRLPPPSLPPLTCLVSISLSHCKGITIQTIRALGALNKALTRLNLRGCVELNSDSVLRIAENWSSVKELDLSFCKKISSNAIISAFGYFGGTLENLNLYYCRLISDDAMVSIAQRCPQLKELNVQGCNEISDVGLCSIAEQCHQVQSITVSNCTKVTDQTLVTFAINCPQLRFFYANHCKEIRQEGITALSEHSENLRELQLKECPKVSDDAFRSNFMVWKKLEHLSLDYCIEITDFTLLQIAMQCPELVRLSVTGCSKVQYSAMRQATTINPRLHIRVEQE